MQLQFISNILLLATTALAQGTRCPASSVFRVNGVLKNATYTNATYTNTTSPLAPGHSFGYLSQYFWYSSYYYAILDPVDSWTTTTAYVTDIYNNSDSRLVFPTDDYTHAIGFLLNPLSQDKPSDFAVLSGDEKGTEGVYYDDAGKIQHKEEPGCPKLLQWHGCPHQFVGSAVDVTRLGYRLQGTATPKGCYDIDLVIEYMTGWNTPTGYPPKCWPSS